MGREREKRREKDGIEFMGGGDTDKRRKKTQNEN
jgi:hypothetical protein